MFERIDVHVKRNGRWQYVEGCRMHPTLAAARRHYEKWLGEPVQTRWSERCAL